MRTLLLADDSVTVQRVIALTFADEQIRVVTVADGQQAMERMVTERPDIVLAGTTLPQVSGYDLARFMRSKPELKNVPVLLLTGAFETVDDARLKASGANGVIEKPVAPTNVIGRVKELLGLKSDAKPATAGRLITPADGPAEKQLPKPTPPRAVTSTLGTPSKWQQLRDRTGLEPNTRSVEDASTRSEDYLDTLDAAFDSLDQQLSGRVASAKPSRNPSGPLGQSSGAPDPRSPGRRPPNGASAPGNPVFEVDDEWFGSTESQVRADARAGRREIQEDLHDPDLHAPAAAAPPNPIFEVDDDWFAEDNKARAEKEAEQRALAAEMGIHDVDLPQAEPVPNAPAPVSDRDFDFGIDDLRKLQEPEAPEAPEPAAFFEPKKAYVELPKRVVAPPPAIVEPPPPVFVAPPPPPVIVEPVVEPPKAVEEPMAPQASISGSSREVADDFAQLLAFEQGEHHEPPMPPPPEIRLVAPEITEEILEQLAGRVTDRLNAGLFGEALKSVVAETVRSTVRQIAAEASERIVREVANEASGRIARDVAAEASERIVREVAAETSDRIARDVAFEATERIVREVATEASTRIVRSVAADATERIIPGIATEASERIVRDITAESSQRIVREIVSDTSERLVRDEIDRIKNKSR